MPLHNARFSSRRSALLLPSCLALLAIACANDKTGKTDATNQAGNTGTTDQAHTNPSGKPILTGAVSEAEFKAMHQLKTDVVKNLRGEMIDLAGGKAYLSLPAGAQAPVPGIVVIQEWWGLNDNIKLWADRLAAVGYAAIAVDLYDGKLATSPDSAMAFMKRVDDARSQEILLAGHRFLMDDARVKAAKTGSVGWCFGGHQSLRLAMAAPELDACVMYYGMPVTEVEQLKAIKAPLLAIFGQQDEAFPPALVAEFDKALTEAGVQHEIVWYEGDHAFANPSNSIYNAASASAAWEKTQAFFASKLKGEAKP